MILNKTLVRSLSLMMAVSLFAGSQLAAQDGTASQANELATLRAAVAAQQKQLDSLQQLLEKQQTLLDKFLNAGAPQPQRATLGTVASLAPVVPLAPVTPIAIPEPAMQTPAAASTTNNAMDALRKSLDDIGGKLGGFKFSGDFARDMTYSIAWGLFALGLLVAGILKKISAARYAAMALLCVTLLKLFFHDLARLGPLYRIGAFIAVAVIAMLASFAYQKFFSSTAKTQEIKDETE